MNNSRQNNCDDVVELLVKKYWSESKSELDQKIAKMAQDFINRRLFNSTVRVSNQLHTEFEYVQKLIEYIFESLKQDFIHIPLATCKNKLLAIVESEYTKLIPRTTSRLVESNLAQKGIMENYEKVILDEMKKAKEKIEIQCAISEKEKVAVKHSGEKWYKDRKFLIGVSITLLVAIISWSISIYYNNSSISSEITTSGDSSLGIITSGPNSPAMVDYNAPGTEQLHAESQPIIRRSEELIQPEETKGDVNRPKISPIFKIPERKIAPEETAGEVNEPKKSELIKRKEKQIEPEEK